MKILCFYCGNPVSNELPEDTVFRATAECPECTDLSNKERKALALKRYLNTPPKQ